LDIKELPVFKKCIKNKEWYGLIPNLLTAQINWINKYSKLVVLDDELKVYLNNALSIWNSSIVISGNGHSFFSIYSLRPIMERLARIWTVLDPKIDTISIITAFESENLKTRTKATQIIMDYANSKDKDFKALYDLLSRYFGHLGKLDNLIINKKSKKFDFLNKRVQTIPYLLILEIGLRIFECIKQNLDTNTIQYKPLTSGNIKTPYSIENYIRICSYIICEKHSRKKSLNLGLLIKNVVELNNSNIGITDVYRGGMTLFRFGDNASKVETKKMQIASIFVLGPLSEKTRVNVKLIESTDAGEHYELNWDKTLELSSSAIFILAASKTNKTPTEFFDYVGELVDLIKKTD